ncbi:MAG: methyltransferase domain-containing protein [Flavobacteriales bacterium]|nr:methyltransferase domain-containing protein [Flavobacteriales bacterium]
MPTADTESGNWFREWFNSPYYHVLYRHRDQDEARGFVQRIMAHLDVPAGGRVLDLACGAGRHSVELHRLGYEVVGLDLSEESIEEARRSETEGLEFFVHDMRSLYWADHFDAVLNLFTSFGYFHSREDDQRTISSVRDALRPGGVFVLDFLNVRKVVSQMVGDEELEREGLRFVISRRLRGSVIEKDIRVVDGETELDFKEEVDALTLADFESYYEEAGMEIIGLFGSYDLAPYDEADSDRLIMVAQKTKGWEI